ncbi:phage integrase N-terminal SAM-like domain-containing protein [Pseudorhodoferax sp. Leaf265]|uniref:phage integrase N-terminal SAM-like domain-containing protein n=1 Tax=Pseudorhodoferax sp. Leaf265 TaxID=1736315 RepID=UPI00350E9C58
MLPRGAAHVALDQCIPETGFAYKHGVASPPLQAPRLLDRVRERIRRMHYSQQTEKAYVHWCRALIRFHGLRIRPTWARMRSRPF